MKLELHRKEAIDQFNQQFIIFSFVLLTVFFALYIWSKIIVILNKIQQHENEIRKTNKLQCIDFLDNFSKINTLLVDYTKISKCDFNHIRQEIVSYSSSIFLLNQVITELNNKLFKFEKEILIMQTENKKQYIEFETKFSSQLGNKMNNNYQTTFNHILETFKNDVKKDTCNKTNSINSTLELIQKKLMFMTFESVIQNNCLLVEPYIYGLNNNVKICDDVVINCDEMNKENYILDLHMPEHVNLLTFNSLYEKEYKKYAQIEINKKSDFFNEIYDYTWYPCEVIFIDNESYGQNVQNLKYENINKIYYQFIMRLIEHKFGGLIFNMNINFNLYKLRKQNYNYKLFLINNKSKSMYGIKIPFDIIIDVNKYSERYFVYQDKLYLLILSFQINEKDHTGIFCIELPEKKYIS
jgi:hypothetical protein